MRARPRRSISSGSLPSTRGATNSCRYASTLSAAKLVSIEEARRRRAPWSLAPQDLPLPEFTGTRFLNDFPLSVLREYIDWTPFFHTWELRGVYPKIPYTTEDQVRSILAVADHPRATGADPKDFFDNRWLKEVEDSGFINELYGRR